MASKPSIALPLLRLGPEFMVHETPTRRVVEPTSHRERAAKKDCHACNGSGWVRHRHAGRYTRWHGVEGRERCPVCQGCGIACGREAYSTMR